MTRAREGASTRGEAKPLKTPTAADTWHPLNACIAERSWGAPPVGRSAEVIVEMTEPIVADGDDGAPASRRPENGAPVPLA
jgi:hypothetical protein